MTTGVKFNSGKTFLIGFGTKITTPIDLDPVRYEGAMAYGDDNDVYFSDGADWVVISGATIRRPTALQPILPEHFRQLRLSGFQTAVGATTTQTGVLFKVSTTPDMTNIILTESITSTTANSYELPNGFLAADTIFYWQGKYFGTENQESQFSRTFAQVYPKQVDTPIPINLPGARTLVLVVGPYGSAFGYTYQSTSWEIYTTSEGGVPLLSEINNDVRLNLGPSQNIIVPGGIYYWRARFTTDSAINSAFSARQAFQMDNSFLVRDTTDEQVYVARTILNSFNDTYAVPATVLSSDGTPYVCP